MCGFLSKTPSMRSRVADIIYPLQFVLQQCIQGLFVCMIGPTTEQHHCYLLQAGWLLYVFDDGAQGDGCSLAERVAVDASAERRERDAFDLMFLRQFEAAF